MLDLSLQSKHPLPILCFVMCSLRANKPMATNLWQTQTETYGTAGANLRDEHSSGVISAEASS